MSELKRELGTCRFLSKLTLSVGFSLCWGFCLSLPQTLFFNNVLSMKDPGCVLAVSPTLWFSQMPPQSYRTLAPWVKVTVIGSEKKKLKWWLTSEELEIPWRKPYLHCRACWKLALHQMEASPAFMDYCCPSVRANKQGHHYWIFK